MAGWDIAPKEALAVITRVARTAQAYGTAQRRYVRDLDDVRGAGGQFLPQAVGGFADNLDGRMRSVTTRTDRFVGAGRQVVAAYQRGDVEMAAAVQRAAAQASPEDRHGGVPR